jgi:hypothetical protein
VLVGSDDLASDCSLEALGTESSGAVQVAAVPGKDDPTSAKLVRKFGSGDDSEGVA